MSRPEIKYALLQKPAKGDKINATLTLKWGSESKLQNKQMISNLTAQMLKKGTKTRSKMKINDELDRLKATINFSSSPSSLNINVSTDKKNLEATLILIDDLLRNPSFDTSEFSKILADTRANIESSMNDPQTTASEKLSSLTSNYPKSHPPLSKPKLQK